MGLKLGELAEYSLRPSKSEEYLEDKFDFDVPGLHTPGSDDKPNEADIINARISREQYKDYQKRYQPIEKQYVKSIRDPKFVERGVEDARQRINQAETVSQGITNRNISRAGLNVTPEQMETLDRLRKMGAAKNMTYGLSTARDQYSDIQLEGLNTVAGYGRGLAKNVTDIRGNLAEQGARRDAANDVADANEDQAEQSALMQLGMVAFMAFSSEEYKENIQPADIEALHQRMMEIDVKEFDYRADAPAEVAGRTGNIGPIAEQLPDLFVSKDGKQVNVYNVVFSLLASHQRQARRISQLESRIGV